ncbi:squalene/phytoene synthase family protein [Labrys sp. LIt4]|uniref:Phytoene/squalene synthase family protein n=2 Tax=Xanthobacteraceae TaxID=335928 RepID=A0A2S9Q6Z1_9HYPH|nr:squalene/phytoene synthase family protein [Labrys sp. LIt4]PRH85116.1 phytoene/squalene synthase family protein [Labrys okinawensis]
MSNEAYCASLLREHDRNRWLANLFAPAEHRRGLNALYAFNSEIERIRDMVSEPLPGEVRLQWWRDLLEGQARGHVSGHPVASELLAAVDRYHLPVSALATLIDAHTHDLYDDLLQSIGDLEGYCGEAYSSLFRLASLILADGGDPGSADLAGHAGVAYGIASLMKQAARHAARGQIFVPADLVLKHGMAREDLLNGRNTEEMRAMFAELAGVARHHLDTAEQLLPAAPVTVAPAYIGLGLVDPLLRRMARPGFDRFRHEADLPQWRSQWHLWRFSRKLR